MSRETARLILESFYPYYIAEGSFAVAEEYLKAKKGLIIIINHFSKGDVLAVLNFCLSNEFSRSVPQVLIPIASHQVGLGSKVIGSLTHVDFSTVVTPHASMELEQPQRQGEGLKAYLKKAKEVLESGGIVGLALNAERQPRSAEAGHVLTLLGRFLKKRGLVEAGLQPIGVSLRDRWGDEIDDYSQHRGLNLGQPVVLRLGECFSLAEALVQSQERELSLDGLVYEQMKSLVDPSYL